MIDKESFRPVVYADTPRLKATFKTHLANHVAQKDYRRLVVLVFGSSFLPEVLHPSLPKFHSILVFDTVQTLLEVKKHMSALEIVDMDLTEVARPKPVTAGVLASLLERLGDFDGPLPDIFMDIRNALVQRKPSILETTSRLNMPEATPLSGCQTLLAQLKPVLNSDISFMQVLDTYVRYLFGMTNRNNVTQSITKKLPEQAKSIFKQALDFADSPIGKAMSAAYQKLCLLSDKDYKIHQAVKEYNLMPYAGDFMYFVSVLPPSKEALFIAPIIDAGLVSSVHVPVVEQKKVRRAKGVSGRTD
jgi:hypothetical protein